MKIIEEYRAHAEKCRSMANRSFSPEDKKLLLNMAATWDLLAVDRPAHIARLARSEKLETASVPIDRLNASNDG